MEANYSPRKARIIVFGHDRTSIAMIAITERPPSVTFPSFRYKFIVDGEWRFSPEDPCMPDINGNINNYIDTTNFKKMIEETK